MPETKPQFEVFVSYASEDRDFVSILVDALIQRGLKVWYDQGQMRVGDSIQRQIENALANSKYFLIVLSHNFFSKQWTHFEFGVAIGRAEKNIVPVFLNIDEAHLKNHSPFFAARNAIHADTLSIHEIVVKVLDRVKRDSD